VRGSPLAPPQGTELTLIAHGYRDRQRSLAVAVNAVVQEATVTVRNYPRSISDILSDVVHQFSTLVRKEAQLARAEASEKITDLALGLGLLVGGAVLLVPALVILLQAAVAALIAAEIATVWATLIVGGAALAIGVGLLAIGISRLKAAQPIPTKTIEQFQQDAEVAKSQLENDYGAPNRTA